MFDRYLQPHIARVMRPLARSLVQVGIGADFVTVVGFAIGVAAVPLLAIQSYSLALACIAINRVCDGLDGVMARLTEPTHRGAFLDIAFDFFFYSSVPFAFALADPAQNALPAAALLLAFVGTSSSFLAFAVIAQQRQLTSTAFPDKGIYYLGGLTEGAETIVLIAAMCIWPHLFPLLAWTFSVLCLLTTMTRWWWGWQRFTGQTTPTETIRSLARAR